MEHYRNTSLELIKEEIGGVVFTEVWRPIIEYCGIYSVSSFGRIKRNRRKFKHKNRFIVEKILLPKFLYKRGKKTYLRILLGGRNGRYYFIHRLVAIHFLTLIDGKFHINHKTGEKANNHYSQLEWCTPKENNEHGIKMGLIKIGIKKQPFR